MVPELRVLVLSTSRGDFGHLVPLVEELTRHPRIFVDFLALGSGIASSTVFDQDKSPIAQVLKVEEIEMPNSIEDWLSYVPELISRLGSYVRERRFDCAVLLGDRIELMALSGVLLSVKIPIVHIHGGEVTSGAIDNLVRDSITKAASLHFPAYEMAGERIISMLEPAERVHVLGALAVDSFAKNQLLGREELEAKLNLVIEQHSAVVTFHPVTAGTNGSTEAELFFDDLENVDMQLFVTPPNQDPGREAVVQRIEALSSRKGNKVHLMDSLGSTIYYSLINHSGLVIGNSSSGVIDAPIAGVRSIDFGTRQGSRWRPDSVHHVKAERGALLAALSSVSGWGRLNPSGQFGTPGVATRMVETLLQNKNLLERQK